MPKEGYRPDQPEYYESIIKLDTLNNLIGGIPATINKEEIANAFANEDNFRAYAISCLPQKASPKKIIDTALAKAPMLRIDESQQQERRQLSERARKAILEAAVRKVMGQKGRAVNNRLDAVFYQRGTDAKTADKNVELEEKIKQSPEERGRLLTERVNHDLELYHRILAGAVTKEELIDNFEQIHMVLDLVMNATNFLNESIPGENNKVYATFSPEIKEILVDMERHSIEVSLFVNKIRIMANPNYEFMDLEQLLDLDNETYDEIDTYGMMEANDLVMEDAVLIPGTDRTLKKSCGRDNLMKRIAADFPEEFNEARLDLFGTDGKFRTMQYSTEHKVATIEENVHKDDILVTLPSGKVACYHLDNTNGRVQDVDSSGFYAKVTASANDVLKGLKKANKGLFIGSKEYTNTLKGMPGVLMSVKEVGNPPDLEKMDEAIAKLQAVLEESEKYLDRKRHDPKDPEKALYDIWKGMSKREKNRYNAMEQAALYCKAQLNVYAMKRQEMEAEMLAQLDPEEQVIEEPDNDVEHDIENVAGGANVAPQVEEEPVNMPIRDEADPVVEAPENTNIVSLDSIDVFPKVTQVYGDDAAIPESNVGNAADMLRKNIHTNLTRLLSAEEFNAGEAKETFSNMVLLELIKDGRSMNDFGEYVAGDLEETFANNSETVLQAVQRAPYIQAITDNLDVMSFRQFIMTDLAKHMANKWLEHAKLQNNMPENKGSVLQNENRQEIQMQ